jgi:hypothetical protein
MPAYASSARPKGWITWKPQPHVAAVVGQVQQILLEYGIYGPMTVRQVFYRLVGQYNYPKEEKAYNRLAEYLVRARRAGMVGFGSIRDDGTVSRLAARDYGRENVWQHIRSIISEPDQYLHLDRNTGQPHHIELWCEQACLPCCPRWCAVETSTSTQPVGSAA